MVKPPALLGVKYPTVQDYMVIGDASTSLLHNIVHYWLVHAASMQSL